MPEFGSSVPSSLRLFFTQALTELYHVQGTSSSKLHKQIFGGGVHGAVYQNWFLKRVKKITMTDSCAVTAKIDSEGEPGVIYISRCVNPSPEENQKFYWISVLFHEARHLEPHNQHWKHEICLDSSSQVSACDSSPAGAFALEKILAHNVAQFCNNCDKDFVKQALEVYEDSIVWNKLKNQAIKSLELDFEGDL